ncbi:MAG TPA: hypothetical protein VH760_03780 [Gaiellaceae bacterium]
MSSSQRAAPSDPVEPGERSGYSRESSWASVSADAPSNWVVGVVGAGSARRSVRSTLKAAMSSGSPTRSHVPR